LFRNLPCCNDEGFHKEVVIEITSSPLHHLEKKVLQIAIEDQSIASNHCEWTSEEQMYSSFFPVQVT
jgi:hypothetical protein